MTIQCARMGGPNRRAAHSNARVRIALARKTARLAPVCTDFLSRSTQDRPETPIPGRVGAPADGTVTVRSTGYNPGLSRGHFQASILRERLRSTPNSTKKQSPRPPSFGRGRDLRLFTSSEATIAPTSGLGAFLSQDTVTACRVDACVHPAHSSASRASSGLMTPRSSPQRARLRRWAIHLLVEADQGLGHKPGRSATVPR